MEGKSGMRLLILCHKGTAAKKVGKLVGIAVASGCPKITDLKHSQLFRKMSHVAKVFECSGF